MHRLGRQQHVGQKDLVRAEPVPDHGHAGDQPLVEDRRDGDLLLEGFAGQIGHTLHVTPLQGLGDPAQLLHSFSPASTGSGEAPSEAIRWRHWWVEQQAQKSKSLSNS